MKKSILAVLICLAANFTNAQTINFTVTNSSSSYSITCSNPSVVLNATTNYTGGTVTFYWGNATSTLSGNSATLTTPGIYTVGALSIPNYATQTLTIYSNTAAPINTLSPVSIAISCTTAPVTVTLSTSSPTVNYTSTILSPSGGSITSANQNVLYTPSAPGVYTTVVTNQVNGCSTQKNFTVTSSSTFPSFTLASSPPAFTLGCSSKSISTISFANPQAGTPGAPLSYTLIPPGASTLVNGPFGNSSSFSINIPGNYLAIIYEVGSGCSTKVPFTVLQNTFAPSIDSLIVPKSILDCNTPVTNLRVYSSTPNVGYTWGLAASTATGSAFSCSANLSAPSVTAIGNVTCSVVDNNNLCKTTTVITIYQNVYVPNAKIAANGINFRTCFTPSLVLTNISSSGIPSNSSFSNTMPVVGLIWMAPSPQPSLGLSSSYTTSSSGVYSLTAKDQNNGCTANAVFIVDDCSGIGTISGSQNISIYPNPCVNLITVSVDGGQEIQITISDLIGKKVKSEILKKDKTIDVTQLAKGEYFMTMSENNKTIKIIKFIKD